MSKALRALPWLTTEQALTVLKEITKKEISESVLVDHCKHRNCDIHIFIDGQAGRTEDPLPVGEHDWTNECYAEGPQMVVNPDALIGYNYLPLDLCGKVKVRAGEFYDDFTSHDTVTWKSNALLTKPSPQYRTTSIIELGWMIKSKKTREPDPRETRSIGRLLNVLAEMANLDCSKPYKAAEILFEFAASNGIPLDLTDETIVKYLEYIEPIKK